MLSIKGPRERGLGRRHKITNCVWRHPKEIEEYRKTYAISGRKGIVQNDLQASLANWEKDHWHTDAFFVAMAYVELGDKDKAFAWIDKLIELRSTWLIWIYPGAPLLRDDPRFAEVKRKMGVQMK